MVFLGRSIAEHRNYSESVARRIDAEVRRIISHAHQLAVDIMAQHRHTRYSLARLLIENETLGEHQVAALLASAASRVAACSEGGGFPS